jgi:hypothetical protein
MTEQIIAGQSGSLRCKKRRLIEDEDDDEDEDPNFGV